MLTSASILRGQDYSTRRLYGRHAPAHLFTRDSGEYEWDGSLFVPRVLNQPIYEPTALASGLERVALIVHPGTEEEVAAPFNFADPSWAMSASLTRADAISCIQDQTASKITNTATGSASIFGTFGTWNGSPQTTAFTLERGSHSQVNFGMRDTTAVAWVYFLILNFDTGVVTLSAGAGTAFVRLLRKVGPNGGRLYRILLTATGTAGNGRRVAVYPTSTAAVAGHSFVHEMGCFESPFAPNPAPGPANTPKVASELRYLNPPPPRGWIEYWHWSDFFDGLNGADRVVREIGAAAATPRALLSYNSEFSYTAGVGEDFGSIADVHDEAEDWGLITEAVVAAESEDRNLGLTAYLHNGTAAATSTVNATPSRGAENEAVIEHLDDGSVRLLHRRDGEELTDGGLSDAPAGGLPAAWVAGASLGVGIIPGSATSRGSFAYHRWTILNGDDADTDTATGAAHEIYAEVRRAVDSIPADGRVAA